MLSDNRGGTARATSEDERGAKLQSDKRSGRVSDKEGLTVKIQIPTKPKKIISVNGRLELVDA